MSFIGTPFVELVAPHLVRITGVSLDPQESATIGLTGTTGTPDIVLPSGFRVADGSLVQGTRVTVNPVSGEPGPKTNLPPSIEKSGTAPSDFAILITNTKVDLRTQTLEIYVESVVAGVGSRTVNITVNGPLIEGE